MFDRFDALVRSFPEHTAHPDFIKLDELLSDVHEFKKRGAPRIVTLERMDSFKATNKGLSKAGIRTNATNFLRRVKPNVSDRQVYYFLKEVRGREGDGGKGEVGKTCYLTDGATVRAAQTIVR